MEDLPIFFVNGDEGSWRWLKYDEVCVFLGEGEHFFDGDAMDGWVLRLLSMFV